MFCVSALFFFGLHPALAEAQVDIYPGTNIQGVMNNYPGGTTFRLKSGVHRNQTDPPEKRR